MCSKSTSTETGSLHNNSRRARVPLVLRGILMPRAEIDVCLSVGGGGTQRINVPSLDYTGVLPYRSTRSRLTLVTGDDVG